MKCPRCGSNNIVVMGKLPGKGNRVYCVCSKKKEVIEYNLYGLPLISSVDGCGFVGFRDEFIEVSKDIAVVSDYDVVEDDLDIIDEYAGIVEETDRVLGVVEDESYKGIIIEGDDDEVS